MGKIFLYNRKILPIKLQVTMVTSLYEVIIASFEIKASNFIYIFFRKKSFLVIIQSHISRYTSRYFCLKSALEAP